MAETKAISYLKGEDAYASEAFEPLWRDVLTNFAPQNRVALIVPCTWAKPYFESYVTQAMLSSIIGASHAYLVEKERPLVSYLKENRLRDVLDLIDIWHMSSCGYVPVSWQYKDNGEIGFYAYDWDSSRATEEDIKSWFVAAERRTKQWVDHFGNIYDKTLIYLRSESKSLKVWKPYLEEDAKFVRASLDMSGEGLYPLGLKEILTLNGRRTEPDLPLLSPFNTAFASLTIVTILEEVLGFDQKSSE